MFELSGKWVGGTRAPGSPQPDVDIDLSRRKRMCDNTSLGVGASSN